jgi:hypothetical protein
MTVISALPTSRRGYLSQAELAQFANITVKDTSEADDVISQAEEIIDAYIRRASKFIPYREEGIATGGTTTTLIDSSSDSPFTQDDDYWKGCEVEIVGGTNAGERRKVTAYDKTTKTLTVDSAFTDSIDSTSVYVIYQLGFFPRVADVHHISSKYYKRIPEAIKRAVAAQVEYIIEKGDSFFKGGADFKSESIDDYSYERAGRALGFEAMIAPKARQFLRGFVSRIGVLEAENPTNL